MLRLGDVGGSPYVGVYCAASENLAVLPDGADGKTVKGISQVLGVDVILTNIGGSTVVGSLVAMNSFGVVVTNFAEEAELRKLPEGLRVHRMEERFNAAGNNILLTDRAAVVNPGVSAGEARRLADTLGVEVVRRRIAGIDTVGSVCVATSKGIICHPRTPESELKEIGGIFGVPATIATLNYGTPYLGACAVANSRGAYVGSRSTPIELGRLEDGLGLY